VKKTRQNKKLEPGFDSIKAGNALNAAQREIARCLVGDIPAPAGPFP
jgi:hypothetical protein